MPIYTASHVVPVTSSPIVDGAVGVKDGRINAIGTLEEVIELLPREQVIEHGESAIVPGFVNCHTHLKLTAFRGQLDRYDHDFCKWLIEITRLRLEHDAADEIELSALLGACEAASSGVTTVGDIGRVGSAGVSALIETGLRGIVFQETEFSPDGANADQDFDALRRKFEILEEECGGHVSAGLSPHAPYTVSRELFEKISRFSIENKVLMSIHAAESAAETELMTSGGGTFSEAFFRDSNNWVVPHMNTVEYFSKIGVLDAAPLLAHCIRVSPEEMALISKSGTRVAHCPKSNAKFGHGSAPLDAFMEKGIAVGLGSDSMASNNSCDMLEEARFAGLIARLSGCGQEFIDPQSLFHLITMGGASALGLGQEIGSLEEGKQADIAVISLAGIGQVPVNDIYSALIFSTGAASVTSVMVGGEVIYDDGLLTRVDSEDVRVRVGQSFKH